MTKKESRKCSNEKGESPARPNGTEAKEPIKLERKIIQTIDINRIVVNKSIQPRSKINKKHVKKLAASIEETGLENPLIVRQNDEGTYDVVCGFHRYEALKILGVEKVDCIFKIMDDKEARITALVDNIQREDMTLLEMAHGFGELKKKNKLTYEEIAKLTGKSKSIVSRYVRVIECLPGDFIQRIESGEIDFGIGVSLVDIAGNKRLLKKVFDGLTPDMTVSDVRELVAALRSAEITGKESILGLKPPEIVSDRIKYRLTKNKKIKVTANFENADDLREVVRQWAVSLGIAMKI